MDKVISITRKRGLRLMLCECMCDGVNKRVTERMYGGLVSEHVTFPTNHEVYPYKGFPWCWDSTNA